MTDTFTMYAQGLTSQALQRLSYAQNITPSTFPSFFVHPKLLDQLRPLLPYGQTLRFTCPQQAEAIQSCTTNSHVLIVMPTGSGKSLAFFAAPLLMPDKMFIVVTPLVALTSDMSHRLAATPIRSGMWSSPLDPFTVQVVLVSAHQAGTMEFFHWAKTNALRIYRFFIDEAHHVITSDNYRECFKLFNLITELGKPVTFLTATLFDRSIPRLCESMRIDPALLLQIRANTARPSIKIRVTRCADFHTVTNEIERLFRSIELSPTDRGLIFCTTVANCKDIARALGIDYYVAKLKQDEEENALEQARLEAQWRS
jgi:superfamily II DNA helicase RecQ